MALFDNSVMAFPVTPLPEANRQPAIPVVEEAPEYDLVEVGDFTAYAVATEPIVDITSVMIDEFGAYYNPRHQLREHPDAIARQIVADLTGYSTEAEAGSLGTTLQALRV